MTETEKLTELLRPWTAHLSLVTAKDLIANGVTFAKDTDVSSKWISVEDRLPHAEYGESDNVLTINRVGICKVLYFDGGCWCYPTGEPVYFGNPRWRITHWMPLPEPPVGNPSVSLEADSSLCTREPSAAVTCPNCGSMDVRTDAFGVGMHRCEVCGKTFGVYQDG